MKTLSLRPDWAKETSPSDYPLTPENILSSGRGLNSVKTRVPVSKMVLWVRELPANPVTSLNSGIHTAEGEQ